MENYTQLEITKKEMLKNAIRFGAVNDTMLDALRDNPKILSEAMSKDTIDVISNVLVRIYGQDEGLVKTLQYVKSHIDEKDTCITDIKDVIYRVILQLAQQHKHEHIENFDKFAAAVKGNKLSNTVDTFLNIFNAISQFFIKK